jgi:hypothetical protein
MDRPTKKLLRCAIYTRKSTDHNLDLEFNSLDAQREACEAYIKSQAHEGLPVQSAEGASGMKSLRRVRNGAPRRWRAQAPRSSRRRRKRAPSTHRPTPTPQSRAAPVLGCGLATAGFFKTSGVVLSVSRTEQSGTEAGDRSAVRGAKHPGPESHGRHNRNLPVFGRVGHVNAVIGSNGHGRKSHRRNSQKYGRQSGGRFRSRHGRHQNPSRRTRESGRWRCPGLIRPSPRQCCRCGGRRARRCLRARKVATSNHRDTALHDRHCRGRHRLVAWTDAPATVIDDCLAQRVCRSKDEGLITNSFINEISSSRSNDGCKFGAALICPQ